jgi:hypothetical protein
MEKRKYKKLDKTAKWGGKVYEYRGFEIRNITSPNASYGEWYTRGEAFGETVVERGNTRERVAECLDREIYRLEQKMLNEIADY